jgi:hypothetical protein
MIIPRVRSARILKTVVFGSICRIDIYIREHIIRKNGLPARIGYMTVASFVRVAENTGKRKVVVLYECRRCYRVLRGYQLETKEIMRACCHDLGPNCCSAPFEIKQAGNVD